MRDLFKRKHVIKFAITPFPNVELDKWFSIIYVADMQQQSRLQMGAN